MDVVDSIGIIRFNIWILIIDFILIFAFFISWYRSYKITRWKLDYWNLILFINYFIPFLLMYPFASADLNILSVFDTTRMDYIQSSITKAYFISLIGYIGIFLGGYIFKIYKYKNFINYIFILPFKITFSKLFKYIVYSKICCYILYTSYFICLFVIMALSVKAGKILDTRSYFYENTNIRFLYNFVIVLSSIVSLIITARIFQFNKKVDKVFFTLFILATILIGARAFVISPIIQYLTFYIFFKKQGKVKLLNVGLIAAILLFCIVFLGAVRTGNISYQNTVGVFFIQVFYGNSFSDLRDFSWVLSYWDGKFIYGKSYLAAFMSFVPSFLSSYRTEWGIGRITATIAGLDTREHPGLRPGTFGEAYLNFGISGVFILGILLGYSYKYIDHKIRYYSMTDNNLEGIVAVISTIFITNLPITAGFYTIYVFVIVMIIFTFLKKLLSALGIS